MKGLREMVFGPKIRPVTPEEVQAAPSSNPELDRQLERGSLTLMREAFLTSMAASRAQQRIAVSAALGKLHGR